MLPGGSCSSTAAIFGTSPSFVINLMRRYRQTGELAPRPCGGVRHRKLTAFQNELINWVEAQPDLTLGKIADRLRERYQLRASTSGLSDLLRRAGYTYKSRRGHKSIQWIDLLVDTPGQRGYARQA